MSFKVQKFGELASVKGGYAFSSKDSVRKGIRWLKIANVGINKIKWDTIDYLPSEFSENHEDYILEEGDIVLALTRPILDRKLKIARLDHQDSPCLLNQRVGVVIVDEENVLSDFIYYLMQTEWFINKILVITAGTDPPNISTRDLSKIEVSVPEKNEQKVILEILAIWDETISKTEKLIKAKKRYKKGLMQRLLSGKVRFPEFEEEEWVEVKLGELFDRIAEKNESESIKNVLTISAQDGLVSQTDYYNKSVASKDLSNYIVLRQGDFAYNKSYSEGYPLGAIKRLNDYEKGVLSPLYICFKLTSDKVDSEFITHYFEFGGLDHGIYKIAREGARNHGLLNVSVKDFIEIDLTIPQYEEQKKIASVLNEATKEIGLLEAQFGKYQQQKKGLMQQLLTGKVRLSDMEGV